MWNSRPKLRILLETKTHPLKFKVMEDRMFEKLWKRQGHQSKGLWRGRGLPGPGELKMEGDLGWECFAENRTFTHVPTIVFIVNWQSSQFEKERRGYGTSKIQDKICIRSWVVQEKRHCGDLLRECVRTHWRSVAPLLVSSLGGLCDAVAVKFLLGRHSAEKETHTPCL